MTVLPLWMEILVNVLGYAGFIGIATWHKSSDEITTDSPLRGHSRRGRPRTGINAPDRRPFFGARSQNRTLATVTARSFRRLAGSVLLRDQ